MLGYALGVLRMSYDDFCRCTPMEFREVMRCHNRHSEERRRDGWERARWAAAVIIQPHLQRPVDMHTALPLPWDRERVRLSGVAMSAQARREAALEAMRIHKDFINNRKDVNKEG